MKIFFESDFKEYMVILQLKLQIKIVLSNIRVGWDSDIDEIWDMKKWYISATKK